MIRKKRNQLKKIVIKIIKTKCRAIMVTKQVMEMKLHNMKTKEKMVGNQLAWISTSHQPSEAAPKVENAYHPPNRLKMQIVTLMKKRRMTSLPMLTTRY